MGFSYSVSFRCSDTRALHNSHANMKIMPHSHARRSMKKQFRLEMLGGIFMKIGKLQYFDHIDSITCILMVLNRI